MASKTLSTLIGGSGLPVLSPDLTYPGSTASGAGFKQTTAIDASGGLTEILALTDGAWAINFLRLQNLTVESITIQAVRDGITIWNRTFTATATVLLFGATSNGSSMINEAMKCKNSFYLYLQTATDTSVDLDYAVRPIEG